MENLDIIDWSKINCQNYRANQGSFTFKTIAYLQTHGESEVADIRHSIGLDQYSIDHSMYGISHSSYYFGVITDRLQAKGVIVKTKRGFYKINEK